MNKETTTLAEIKLVGIKIQTSNADEMNPSTAKIGATIQKYFGEDLPSKTKGLKNSLSTYCVYTDYENGIEGKYTYFIGKEVESFEGQDKSLTTLIIPSQLYVKFTTGYGEMPQICIDEWIKIWKMDNKELGGKRAFIADFEVYDERANDPKNTALDIFIGIERGLEICDIIVK